MTDLITFTLSIYFLWSGGSRGFILSLLVPFSIIIATIISIVYFQITKDIIICLLIGLFGPILLNLLFKFFLKHLTKVFNSEIKPGFLSRLGGAIVNLVWGWIFIIFALILLASLPSWGGAMTAVHNDVVKSASYFFVKPWGESLFAAAQKNVPTTTTSTTGANPTDTSTASNNDATSLSQDPRFQAALQDPEVQKEIDAHDIVKLMGNPKMMELTRQIMSDPATFKKVMALYSKQTASQSFFAEPENSK